MTDFFFHRWYAPAPSHTLEEDQVSTSSNNKKRKQNNSKKSTASKKQKTTYVDYTSSNQPIASTSTSTNSTALLSPTFIPQSPDVEKYESLREDPLILEQEDEEFKLEESETSKKSTKKVSFAGPHLPSAYSIPTQPQPQPPSLPTPSHFQPPQAPSSSSKSLLNRDYPEPPGLIEPPSGSGLVEISPEEKLQNALWSWYEAGYNTALYHTALGALEKEKRESSTLKR